MNVTTITDLEQRLADLKEQQAATADAIAGAVAGLVPLNRALERARAVHNEAGLGMLAANNEANISITDAGGLKTSEEYERLRAASRLAEGAFAQADQELQAALVARNSADQRRGDLQMHSYRIEASIGEVERDLERARQAAEPERDLLAKIRAKVLGEPAGAA
jgi:hypothetical protein